MPEATVLASHGHGDREDIVEPVASRKGSWPCLCILRVTGGAALEASLVGWSLKRHFLEPSVERRQGLNPLHMEGKGEGTGGRKRKNMQA